MNPKTKSQIGAASALEKLHIVLGVLTLVVRIPFHLASRAVIHGRFRGAVRASGLYFLRTVTQYKMAQIQWLSPPTYWAYMFWMWWSGVTSHEPAPEVLVDGTRLYWLGPKRTDRVILYVPGGGFWAPIQFHNIQFWNYVRVKLEEKGVNVGVVFLDYTLYPDAGFPVQLRQLCVAVDHILASGVQPRNLHLVGDSAGANLILQLLSHLLNPLSSEKLPNLGPVLLPPLNSASRSSSPERHLGSVYLMSPWVSFESSTKSFNNPRTKDLIVGPNTLTWGRQYALDVPSEQMPYIVPLTAVEIPTWFGSLSRVVNHVLISAGSEERFRDDIVAFAERLGNSAKEVNVQLEVQEGGVHDDPFLDFLISPYPRNVVSLTPLIIDWLKDKIAS